MRVFKYKKRELAKVLKYYLERNTMKKLLPISSITLAILSLLDNFLSFLPYGYMELPIIATVLAVMSIFWTKYKRSSWVAFGISLIALAVTIYFYYFPEVIPY